MRCRVERYYNHSEAQELCSEYPDIPDFMWKPSTLHIFHMKSSKCLCGLEAWNV